MHRMDHKQTAMALAGLLLCLSSALTFASLPWDRPAPRGAGSFVAGGSKAADVPPVDAAVPAETTQVMAVWHRTSAADRQVAVLRRATDGRLEAAIDCLRRARPARAATGAAPYTLVLYDGGGHVITRIECTDDGRFRATGHPWRDAGPTLAVWLKQWQ
jgi:hypothetical protein